MNTQFSDFLTPKQQLFCDEYLTDRNATRAALKAGYSAKTALNGYLMQLPKIKLYLQMQMDKITQQACVTTDMLLRELGKVAFANMADYFDADGKLKPMNELTGDEAAALHSVTISPDGTVRIKLFNKMAALDKIAKHLNFYKPEFTKPAEKYVYLDLDDMNEDDSFDDDRLKEELRAEKKRQQREADRHKRAEAKKVEAEVKNQNFTIDYADNHEPFSDGPVAETDTDDDFDGILRDGAGIPYDDEEFKRYRLNLEREKTKEVPVVKRQSVFRDL